MMPKLFQSLALLLVMLVPSLPALADSGKLVEGKRVRTYELYRPATANPQQPVPLVVVLHGGFGNGAQAEGAYGWDKLADRYGFVVAYPDGVGRSWNAGGICCGSAQRDNVDDVAFLTHLIEKLIGEEKIDTRRVYMTGMSNGAAMSYRYACEGSYKIAAIGAVSGSLAAPCQPTRAVPVMEIHGMQDTNIPFSGGVGSKGVTQVPWLGVPKTMEIFAAADACRNPATQVASPLQTTVWTCTGGQALSLIAIEDAGHQWPGSQIRTGPLSRLFHPDPPSTALDATATLWKFFQSASGH